MEQRALAPLIEQTADGIITEWNDDARTLFGWTREEAIGMRSHMLIPARNRERHDKSLQAFLLTSGRRMLTQEITAQHKDGREFVVEFTIGVKRDGEAPRILAHARVVTPLTRAMHAFDSSPDRFRAILDQIEDGCLVTDLRGKYLFVNDAFCRMFSLSKDNVLGASYETVFSEWNRIHLDQIRNVYSRVFETGEPVKAFDYHLVIDGKPRSFEQSVSLDRDEFGQPVAFIAIVRDRTDRT